MEGLTLLFWASLGGLAYIYAGYPLAVWMLARLVGRPVRRGPFDGGVSVVVVGYNEGSRLAAKLDSILASTAAGRILEVLVGSDGSDDDTEAVVGTYPDPRVCLLHFPSRRGKPAVLNDVVPQCRGDVVVLTDARQRLDAEGIERLTARIVDSSIGVVSGELRFESREGDTAAAKGMGAYWRYEKFLRKCEGSFRSVPGATGAFYAIRRELFRPIAENTLLDDVVIPMQAIERGYRCVLEEGAVAWDAPSQSARQEAVRKRRTIAGCAQLVVNQPRWLLPWRNPVWWEFVSHKLLRLASPVLLASVLVSNVLLAAEPAYAVLLGGQVAFYAAAGAGWLLDRWGLRAKLLGMALMFVSLNVTTAAALWNACRGRFRATWRRAA